MKFLFNIRSLFPSLILNHIADKNNKSFSANEKTIFDLIEDIVIIVDEEGSINYISPSSRPTLGPSYQSLIGKNIKFISGKLQNLITEIPGKQYEEEIIELKDYLGNTRSFKVKTKNDNTKFNRSVLLLKEIEVDPVEIPLAQNEIKNIFLSFPGVFFKLICQDKKYIFIYISSNIINLTDHIAKEIIDESDHFFKSIYPKDVHFVKTSLKNSIQDFQPISLKFRFLKDRYNIQEVELNALPAKKGQTIIWNGTIIKIQEDHRNDPLTLFRNAIEGVSEGVLISSSENDYPIVYVNDQFLKETGYTREEVMGKNPRFLQGEKTDPNVVENVREALKKKDFFRGEIINYRKDGSYFHNLMTINPIYDQNKEVTHFIGLQSNITHRIKIEEALQKSIERYNLAVKATNDVIWDWDLLENKITWPAIEGKVFDYPVNELKNDPLWKFKNIHPEDQQRVHKFFYNILKEKRTYWNDEYRFQNRKGEYLYIIDRAYIIYDQKDNPVRIIGAKQDLTDFKKLLNLQTNLANELSHRNKDLQQFSYIVSHNLRSSIASIKGLTALLEYPENHISEQTNIILKHISNMAENLDETLKDLSTILEIRSDYKEHLELVDFEKIMEKVKGILTDQINTRDIEFIINFEKASSILTLKSYLFSILLNLVSNSIKYRSSERRLKIEISTYPQDSFIVLEVRDNGLGINLKLQKNKIFGLYKRFHPQIEGKGLGLYLVKTQAESLGGKVEVESEERVGSIFKVFFKLSQ